MIDLTAGINADQLLRSINRFRNTTLPKVKSIAAQEAVTKGAEDTIKSGEKALDDPIPAVFQGKKSKNRRGWIYFEWDERADIKRKNGNVDASLQLQGFGPAKARADQQEALHRQIFGTTETKGTTPATPFIIRPSNALLRSKGIRGVPLKIDKFGNIRNYRKNLTKMLDDPKNRFFQVKLGEAGGGKNNNGISLPPGLYMRVLRARKYKRNRHTKRKGGPYGDGARKKDTVGIKTILRYEAIQTYKKRWNFREETSTAMRRRYNEAFINALNREISKQRVGVPTARGQTGRL